MESESKKEWAFRITAIAISIFLFLFAFEVILRIYAGHQSSFIEPPTGLFQHDVQLGWRGTSNYKGTEKHFDFESSITTNSKGFRDKERSTETNEEKRILSIGDSFCWGIGVDNNETYSAILEDKYSDGTEVVNLCMIGYSNDQELLLLRQEGLSYEPDLVVLGLYIGNDIYENTLSCLTNRCKPYFSLEDGTLVLKNVPVPDKQSVGKEDFESPPSTSKNPIAILARNSYAYKFFNSRIFAHHKVKSILRGFGMARTNEDFKIIHTDTLALTEALLLEIKKEVEGIDAKFLLVAIPPNRVVVLPENDVHSEETVLQVSVAEIAANNGIPYLDMSPHYQAGHKNGEIIYFPNEGHLTPKGQKITAQAIHEKIEEEGLLDG